MTIAISCRKNLCLFNLHCHLLKSVGNLRTACRVPDAEITGYGRYLSDEAVHMDIVT